ncbi:MAG: hypothetical protein ACRD0B_00200 [Acidimicrobiales bacterium]
MTAPVESETPAHIVNLRGLPLPADPVRSSPPVHPARLSERNALVLVAAADAGSDRDRFGLGCGLYIAGPSVIAGAVLVPDDMPRRHRAAFARIQEWADSTPVSDRPRTPSFEVLRLAEFFDPKARAGCGHLAFAPTSYTGAAFTIGADLGRFFGLSAQHVAAHKEGDGWSIFPPGWWAPPEKGEPWHQASPNRPPIMVKARREGWQLGWGKTGRNPATGVRYGKLRPGEFVDVCSWAYSLDADRGAAFAEHRENFGLAPCELPARVAADADGAAQVVQAARRVHELACVLDKQAGRWFTTSEERADGRGRFDIGRTASPGGVAASLLRRFDIAPPAVKFPLSRRLHAAWWESFSGGRNSIDERFAGVPFPCVSADVASAFPSTATLLDWWGLLTAERIELVDATEEVRSLREQAAADPRAALDPAVWRQLGFTLCTERLEGEPRPIEIDEEGRPDGRNELVPVYSPDRLMHSAWPDSVAGAILAGTTEGAEVVRAVRLVPVGRQRGLRRRVPIVPGLVCDLDGDPAIGLVRLRREVKASDPVLAGLLHAVVNSAVSGILSRTDPAGAREKAGPWTFVPIAASVQAGARLFLAAFERLLRDAGGVPVYADTDSWLVPASPQGGELTLPDGTTERLLSWPEVDAVAAAFDAMQPFGPDVPAWKLDRGTRERPLWSVVYGPKRHVEFTVAADGEPEIIERTDSGLGGVLADPPSMRGRAADGLRAWSLAAIRRQVRYSLDDSTWQDVASWDAGQGRPALAVRRLQVRSPEVLASLPESLGALAGSYYSEALPGSVMGVAVRAGPGAVALDDGTSDPWDLDWLDRRTGRPVRLSLDPANISAHLVDSLDKRAIAWAQPYRRTPLEAVHVDPLLVQHKGRLSGVIDAEIEGVPGDLGKFRPQYDPAGDAARRLLFVQRRAQAMGTRAFARRTRLPLTIAKRAALGRPVSARNVAKVLRALRYADETTPRCPECDAPVVGRRKGATYCSRRCQDRGAKRRRAERARARAAP